MLDGLVLPMHKTGEQNTWLRPFDCALNVLDLKDSARSDCVILGMKACSSDFLVLLRLGRESQCHIDD